MRFADHAARRIRTMCGRFRLRGRRLVSGRDSSPSPGGASSRMGVFRACPVPTVGPSAGVLKDQKRLLQGSNSELAPIPPFSAQNRLENNCESSSLPDDPPKIPCATEQGINSSRTGNRFLLNRELIRRIRESVTKSRCARFTSNAFSVEGKKLSTMGFAKQQSPTDHERPRAPRR